MTHIQLKTARRHGLSLTALHALLLLAERGPLGMTHLATEIGISTAGITGTSDRLIADHLVARQRRRGDRRAVTLSLTETGRDILNKILGRIDCGSGHDYGICPVCQHGHGYILKSSPATPLITAH